MAMKFCLSTVTSGYFQHYLPILAYTVRKNVPNAYVKTFHRGKLDDITIRTFDVMHSAGFHVDLPIENVFTEYPDEAYTTNCVRFLVPQSYFEGFDYVYMTDADFIYLEHEPPIDSYYIRKLQLWGEQWWGRRGPRRDKLTNGVDKRVAGGGVLMSKDWWGLTEKLVQEAKKKVMSGEIGKIREDDERMLWWIIAGSGLKCPVGDLCSRPKKYKEIHLGDFKPEFKRWRKKSAMAKRIGKGKYYKFFRLEEDSIWRKIVDICCEDAKIAEIFANLREYMAKRRPVE